jgi:hypothetical protein
VRFPGIEQNFDGIYFSAQYPGSETDDGDDRKRLVGSAAIGWTDGNMEIIML